MYKLNLARAALLGAMLLSPPAFANVLEQCLVTVKDQQVQNELLLGDLYLSYGLIDRLVKSKNRPVRRGFFRHVKATKFEQSPYILHVIQHHDGDGNEIIFVNVSGAELNNYAQSITNESGRPVQMRVWRSGCD